MGDRIILHSDMNCFFASVEIMLNPSLRGKAVAVCGSAKDRHGIILAKSEKAKKSGVKTGMINRDALALCPDLILVPPQYEQYIKYSRLAREIYGRYTNLIEPFGMDECWLDLTACPAGGDGAAAAEEIRTAVREELGLTVSIGVSFNKIFAKLGSDMKKPDAVTVISRENFREKVWPLGVGEMIYVGPSTEARLHTYGVRTIGELAAVPQEYLESWFGVNGIKLLHYANGSDMSRVTPGDYEFPVKSVGHGVTCTADLCSSEEVHRIIIELCLDIGHRLRLHGFMARGVEVCLRRKDLSGEVYRKRLEVPSQLPSELAEAAYGCFLERYRWSQNVRAVTVRAINLIPPDRAGQLSIFADNEKRFRLERLEDAAEDIRRRYVKKALTYASVLHNPKMPGDGRDLVKMPGQMYS